MYRVLNYGDAVFDTRYRLAFECECVEQSQLVDERADYMEQG